jgi:hypothetical protein
VHAQRGGAQDPGRCDASVRSRPRTTTDGGGSNVRQCEIANPVLPSRRQFAADLGRKRSQPQLVNVVLASRTFLWTLVRTIFQPSRCNT